ncbi:MAG: DUF2905 domain-containing protein [Thermoflavifilum sp.]|jgi:hypothetical protein|uniref:DUF2905 domain-containing protein n=1 Tax=Thermoflavifilum sp. TaxID=1968839 RepID=UPI0018A49A1A|nr:DUF2905 domain-containing protein [Thermoflavifilum sp.]QOR75792.1 MAG: DUF2905 domain-containing protein [Thermoflavifilum sp.]
MKEIGKWLIVSGLLLLLMGILLYVIGQLGQRLPWLGRLPGDIRIQKPNFVFYAPITTMLLLSILLSALLWIIQRFLK